MLRVCEFSEYMHMLNARTLTLHSQSKIHAETAETAPPALVTLPHKPVADGQEVSMGIGIPRVAPSACSRRLT
jgi:hypothetical protein